MPTVLITGATRGLGLSTAQACAQRGARVLCAGRDRHAVEAAAARVRGEPVVLDLAVLAGVVRVASALPDVDVLVCNAGLQLVQGATSTPDGFEETFAVNHLAHIALVDALLDRPTPPRRIVLVGSATHDPAVRTGTPAPVEDADLTAVAWPVPGDESARTAGMRRYATSKLLAVATAAALARERPSVHVSCFDPGLLPGTGLARQQPAGLRLLWSTAMKGLRVLPFASSATASGRALAQLCTREPPPVPSGSYVDHRLRVVTPSARARDVGYQDGVLRQSRQMVVRALSA